MKELGLEEQQKATVGPCPISPDFGAWIQSNADLIAEARGVSVENPPADHGEIGAQLARARQFFVAMGSLKGEATGWVNKTRALAMVRVRHLHSNMSADERRILTDADPEYLLALKMKTDIAVTEAALKSLGFEGMNDRRSSFSPRMHDNS